MLNIIVFWTQSSTFNTNYTRRLFSDGYIVQEDDAPKFSLHVHPVTGLFSGTAKDLEIYINGQALSRDTATDVFHGQASYGDLIAIRKGDSFLFKYLN